MSEDYRPLEIKSEQLRAQIRAEERGAAELGVRLKADRRKLEENGRRFEGIRREIAQARYNELSQSDSKEKSNLQRRALLARLQEKARALKDVKVEAQAIEKRIDGLKQGLDARLLALKLKNRQKDRLGEIVGGFQKEALRKKENDNSEAIIESAICRNELTRKDIEKRKFSKPKVGQSVEEQNPLSLAAERESSLAGRERSETAFRIDTMLLNREQLLGHQRDVFVNQDGRNNSGQSPADSNQQNSQTQKDERAARNEKWAEVIEEALGVPGSVEVLSLDDEEGGEKRSVSISYKSSDGRTYEVSVERKSGEGLAVQLSEQGKNLNSAEASVLSQRLEDNLKAANLKIKSMQVKYANN